MTRPTMQITGAPIVPLGSIHRCTVYLDLALAWNPAGVTGYNRCPMTGRWQAVVGERSAHQYFPVGLGQPA